jgi:polyhydroxyalkanoate synthesis regulator phasin
MLVPPTPKEPAMTNMQDVRKQLEASFGNLNPSKAQDLAKGMLDRDAAKEQVAKLAADLLDWSQRNRARLTTMIRDEVRDQLRQTGVATQEEVDALRKRVRELERASRARKAKTSSAKRASSRGTSAKSTSSTGTSAKRASSKSTSAKGTAAEQTSAPEA